MTKAVKANLFRGFDDKAAPSAALAVAPPPPCASKDVAYRQRSRRGKKLLPTILTPNRLHSSRFCRPRRAPPFRT